MKRIILIAFCLSAILSCKKNSIAPENTLIATVDGVTKSYYVEPVVTFDHNNQLTFSGYVNNDPSADWIDIYIDGTDPITTKTYDLTSDVSLTYAPPTLSGSDHTIFYYTNTRGDYPVSITIKSIKGDNIQGTFSGQLESLDKTTIISVTNGRFNISVRRKSASD
ncbi:MAG: hypothetical protein JWR50_2570 [Mucilaginibacter sp.]|nr:hypothetical protein [Mucilaginibacter sp.]